MRPARREELGLSRPQFALLKKLDTPRKIQDFIDRIPANFEPDGDTCLSVREVLRQRRAHCIEGAMLAACALWIRGEPPLVMDFKASRADDDHVVALFRRRGRWGAISKTNHVWLRHRDPVYLSLRELAISYFHEYVNKKGRKTLRAYSRALDLRTLDPKLWITNQGNCWQVAHRVDEIRHYRLVGPAQISLLRRRDRVERKAGKLLEHRVPRRRQPAPAANVAARPISARRPVRR